MGELKVIFTPGLWEMGREAQRQYGLQMTDSDIEKCLYRCSCGEIAPARVVHNKSNPKAQRVLVVACENCWVEKGELEIFNKC